MIDRHSDTWQFITERIEQELAKLDKKNRTALDQQCTTECRARISALVDVLSWGDAPQTTPIEGELPWLM